MRLTATSGTIGMVYLLHPADGFSRRFLTNGVSAMRSLQAILLAVFLTVFAAASFGYMLGYHDGREWSDGFDNGFSAGEDYAFDKAGWTKTPIDEFDDNANIDN